MSRDTTTVPNRASFAAGSIKPHGKSEVRAWYFMRFSGLVLTFLALFHLWLNHIQTEVGELSYDLVVFRLNEWPILRVVDFLLLFLGLAHGVNGLKNVIDDHAKSSGQRAFWLGLLGVLFVVFLAAGTAVLFVLPTTGGA